MKRHEEQRMLEDLTRLTLGLLDCLATGSSFELENLVLPQAVEDKLFNVIKNGQIKGHVENVKVR